MTNQTTYNDLAGADVYDQDGHKIGGVNNVYVFDGTDEPSWVTVNTGFFGSHETFVPLANSQANSGGIVVPYEKSFIKDAPNIDPDGELSVEQENELFRYYGIDNPNELRNQAGAPSGEQDARLEDAHGQRDAHGRDAYDQQDARVDRDAQAQQDAYGQPAAGGQHDVRADHDRDALEREIQHDSDRSGAAAGAGIGAAGVGAAGAAAADRGERGDRDAEAQRHYDDQRRTEYDAQAQQQAPHADATTNGARHAATDSAAASGAAAAGATAAGATQQAGATGNLRLRKRVVTETKLVEVPVQREEIVVENPDGTVTPVDGADGGAATR